MAKLLRSQPDSSPSATVDQAVRWVEYAMEHADLAHLKSPLANVPFWVVYSLDIILALVFTVIGFGVIAFKHMVLDKMLARSKEKREEKQEEISSGQNANSGAVVKVEKKASQILGAIAENDDQEEDVEELKGELKEDEELEEKKTL